jgi:sec-independent protein translocase protein TatA
MDAIAPWHIVIVAIVAAVLFFGWKQLPDMSRSLGRSLRIFKTELKGMTSDATEPAAATQPVAVVETVQPLSVVTSDLDR